jgi:hypothetical protein
MRRFIPVSLLVLIVGLPVAVAVLCLEKEALVARASDINLADFKHAQELAERYDPRRMPPERITTVQATSDELDTVVKGALGGVNRIAARVRVTRLGVIGAMTLETPLPDNPLGRYVNIRTAIAPSEHGLEISRLAIGSMEFSSAITRPVILYVLNKLTGDENGQPILDSIRSVRVSAPVVTVAFQPPPGLIETLKEAARQHARVSDPDLVRRYYEEIDDAMSDIPRGGQVSLMEVIRPVFEMAQSRSRDLDPIRENEAALLALAIYFGDPRFERFVGEVRTGEQKSRRQSLDHMRLDGRHDFVQHFTISIGLALAGGDLAANLIGELKEAKDSRNTSGFSFTDIGADRAGVQLARKAVSGESAALRIQRILANTHSEDIFFPRFTDLPEGLSTAVFRQRYGDVNSREYKRVIAEIDKRIYNTRLFK